jgi:signal transduction histidine kinase
MRRRRLPLGVILPAALVVLVATLAALQYHWLGQVSEAERDQLRRSLSQRAREFADDFDRELALIYTTLQTSSAEITGDDRDGFAERVTRWRQAARFPELVKNLYATSEADGKVALTIYREADRRFEPIEWPASLQPISARLHPTFDDHLALPDGAPRLITFMSSPVDAQIPAVVIPVRGPALPEPARDGSPMEVGRRGGVALAPGKASDFFMQIRTSRASLIAELDRTVLEARVLPALADRHFPERGSDRYRVAVVDAGKRTVLTRPEGANVAVTQADVATSFFGLRQETMRDYAPLGGVMTWSMTSAARSTQTPPVTAAPARRADATRSAPFSVVLEQSGGAAAAQLGTLRATGWTLLLQHADGSLDAAVGNARRRNLWLSFSILSVLGMSVALIVLNARRSERLAGQQMDFVATVSHELRTPLAVIRSAAQNLSAGVVHDADQARRYGDLIEDEGRRLTDMVEQVLAYAGLSGNRGLVRAQPIDLGALTREVMTSCAPLTAAEEFDVEVRAGEQLPLVLAEEDAIRRAINNLVTNALKYGREGRWIGVTVQAGTYRGRAEVQVAVSDRGRGIDAEDLPHIFEPFYRGRYAQDRQVQGNGLGLSLVRRIADAHGGRVTVKTSPGAGSTFTIHLPAAAPDVARAPAPEHVADAAGPVA